MKVWQGPGRKGSLRRKHRRDIAFRNLPLLTFREAQRGREKKGPDDERPPPPQLRRDPCLMVASKMAFGPSP